MRRWLPVLPIALLLLMVAAPGLAQENALRLPSVTFGIQQAESPEEVSTLLQVIFLLTVLSLAPAILVMTTSFVRLAVVFSLLRNALGTQQMPPAQVIVGLSLFLTFFIMAPVFNQVNEKALTPYLDGNLGQREALTRAAEPMRDFMLRQTRKKDLALFISVAGEDRPANAEEVPFTSLVPAFMISELKTAFTIGFLLYVPFLVIDMVVASVLLSMGMMMLPPIMVSLPFKLMLFVLVDGWNLIVGSMVKSFY